MYTHIKQVQIIISLLKQYNIRHFVISPGTRHVPLVHSVEIDPYFTCYSVVDERSAAYVALGIAETIKAPVCITCTSATATCNYMPAMQEAFERHIPLIALTSDRARYQRFHAENQCIDQVDMYKPFRKYAVDIPLVQNDEDYWFCNRCVNEALSAIYRNIPGPIQINFLEPLSIMELSTFEVRNIPETRKINITRENIIWTDYSNKLIDKKVLVVCGQFADKVDELRNALKTFHSKFEAVITTDYFSNVTDECFVHSPIIYDVMNWEELGYIQPDIVISYGSKVYSGFGTKFRNTNIEHWHISEEGIIYDSMHRLTNVFQMHPISFFEEISKNVITGNSLTYEKEWRKIERRINVSVDKFTNFHVIDRVLKTLPENCQVHASVLNSMRFCNYSQLPQTTFTVGNICADGIDGALSTAIGQAKNSNKICLLLVGDLSYLYDLNASYGNIPNNLRVLLVNNNAGGEFHFNISLDRISTLNKHIAASHKNTFEAIALSSGFKYLSADNDSKLDEVLVDFFKETNKPILLEVKTDADTDGRELRALLSRNRVMPSLKARILRKIKKYITFV